MFNAFCQSYTSIPFTNLTTYQVYQITGIDDIPSVYGFDTPAEIHFTFIPNPYNNGKCTTTSISRKGIDF